VENNRGELMAKQEQTGDDIIKFLGFGVHPGKIEEFWQSEDEKKSYIKEVQARGGKMDVLEREAALLNVKLMNPADKIISYIGSILLVISFFLPIYSFDISGTRVSGSAISLFLNLPLIGGYASWGGFIMEFALFIFMLFIIACPVIGVLNILGLMNKYQGDDYLTTVKDKSRCVIIPILLLGLLFFILLIGTPQPFGSLGVDAFGEQLNISALFLMTGLGFWMNIAGLAIVFAQRRGL
jgi:hypothetical protein